MNRKLFRLICLFVGVVAFFSLSVFPTKAFADNTPSPTTEPNFGYCTNWATQCFNASSPAPHTNWHGNADQWFTLAGTAGWSITKNPRLAVPGAIAVWSGGGYGHVASVVSTNPTGIVVSEMNWGGMSIGKSVYYGSNETAAQFQTRLDWTMTDNFDNPTTNSLSWASNLDRGRYKFIGLILPIQTTSPPLLTVPNSLNSGNNLNSGTYIASTNGFYALVMQQDGNLVLYQRSATSALALWSSGTSTSSYDPNRTATLAALQPGGVLVLYTSSGRPVWASGSGGQDPATLVVQNDGNVVIYNSHSAIWSSNTWH